MKDRDFVYCEVRQEAPGGLYIIYGESLSDDKAAQAGAYSCHTLNMQILEGLYFTLPTKSCEQVGSWKAAFILRPFDPHEMRMEACMVTPRNSLQWRTTWSSKHSQLELYRGGIYSTR